MQQEPFWYRRWFRPLEQAHLAHLLKTKHGYHGLLMGNTNLDQVEASPVSFFASMRENTVVGFEGVISNFDDLPFEPDSMDVIVLAHALDHCEDPQAVVVEVQKILRHDGLLIICGFNSLRPCARRFWQYEARSFETKGRPCSLRKLKKFLLQSDLRVDHVESIGGVLNKEGGFWDQLLLSVFPFYSIGYIVCASQNCPRVQPLSFSSKMRLAKNIVGC